MRGNIENFVILLHIFGPVELLFPDIFEIDIYL